MKNKIRKQKVYACLMRCLLLYFFLLFSVFSFANIFPSKGQGVLQRKISMSARNMMIEHILEKIEETDSIRFAYQANQLHVDRKVSLTIEDSPLEHVLGMLFDGNVTFEERGDLVILKPANVDAIGIQVSGKVTDAETGEPIPGVNILVKGSTVGTATDADGNFSLDVEDTNAVLVFSFVGYVSKEVPLNAQSTLNVQLEADRKQLEEVVVVGYGSQKRIEVTSAIATIKAKDVRVGSFTNVSEALQGKAPGVEVINNSNSPGGDISVRVRGISSLNNSIQPLYVVDGVPITGYPVDLIGGGTRSSVANSGINFLNPHDIANIEVLKDAASASIYGSRGSNGVVLITTNQGKAGDKFRVTADASWGVQNPLRLINSMDPKEFADMMNTFNANDGGGSAVIPVDEANSKGTDWNKEIIKKNAALQNFSVGLSGGTSGIQYATGLSYIKQEGLAKTSDYDKLSYHLNVRANPFRKVQAGSTLIFTASKRHLIPMEGDLWNSPFNQALTIDPITGIYKNAQQLADPKISPNGNEYSVYSPSRYTPNSRNPVAIFARNFQQQQYKNLFGNFFASYDIVDGLIFKTSCGIEYNNLNNGNFTPDYYISPNDNNPVNTLVKNTQNVFHYTIANTLQFQRRIQEHSLSLLAGTTFENYALTDINASVKGLPGNTPNYRYLSHGTSGVQTSEPYDNWAIISYLARATYNYKEKYFLTANFRTDGSSKFTSGNRWGYFPSVSAAWIISRESFFHPSFLSLLKLRFGYGQIGNQNIASFAYADLLRNNSYYNFGGNFTTPGFGIVAAGNPNVKWETTTDTNFGLDFGFFGNTLTGSIDVYNRHVSNLLLALPAPGFSGYNHDDLLKVYTNVGSLENRGIDIGLNYGDKRGKWEYNAGVVFSSVRNKVTDLGTLPSIQGGGGRNVNGNSGLTKAGYPVAQFFGYKVLGIFQTQEEVDNYQRNGAKIQPNAKPGDFKFAANSDNSKGTALTEDDKQILGSPLPKFTYGYNFDVKYGGFELDAWFYGVYGNKVFEAQRSLIANPNNNSNNQRAGLVASAWHGPGTSNSVPRITAKSSNLKEISDAFLSSGSYLRLRNLNFGYNFPASVCQRLGVTSLKFYVGAQNLFLISKYTGFDPSISTSAVTDLGNDYGGYPVGRTFLAGIKLGL